MKIVRNLGQLVKFRLQPLCNPLKLNKVMQDGRPIFQQLHTFVTVPMIGIAVEERARFSALPLIVVPVISTTPGISRIRLSIWLIRTIRYSASSQLAVSASK